MKIIISALVMGSLMAAGAQAAQTQPKNVRPVYTYAGVKYVSQGLDDYDCRQNGIAIDGSLDLNGQAFVRAGLSDVSGGVCGSTSVNASVGYRAAWGSNSHIYGTLGAQQVSPDQGDSDTGLLLGAGMRGYLVPGIEGYVEVNYTTLGDGEIVLSGGGAYWFNANFAATLDLGVGADQNSFAVGGRLAF
ncbi:MAG: hypothetical protein U5M23_03260 [Marinagarivorans sp.]|nr:hypothetical protein [Marinagarivorans sp.]